MDSTPLNHHLYNDGFVRAMTTNSSSYSIWNNFFLSSGIPNTVANEYAVKFSQHRIQINMLREITKEILQDMGIKAMGDIIAILRHAKNLCTQNELKGGTKTNLGIMKNVNPQPESTNVGSIAQRTSITTSHSSGGPSISKLVGSKIYSRVNLNSGALNAPSHKTSIIEDDSISKRLTSSTVSRSTERRYGGNREKVNLPEKTLTVRYPSAAAMAKVQQRIAEVANINRKETGPTSIKSRLGVNSTVGGNSTSQMTNSSNSYNMRQNQFRGAAGDKRNGSNITNTRSSISNSYLSVKRPSAIGHRDKPNHKMTRLKSTVFNRLGEGPR